MASKDTQTSRPLSLQRERFCQAFVRLCVGKSAAIEAGYAPKHADSMAARLLAMPDVKARVAELAKKVADKAEVSAADVLRELKRLAFVDPAKAFDEHGLMLPLHLMPEDVRRALSFDFKNGKIRHNKVEALELLGKHLKLFTDKVEHEHNVTVELVDLSGDEE